MSTHTFAVLEVDPSVFAPIEEKLREAGYDHAFVKGADGRQLIDMHGIALVAKVTTFRDRMNDEMAVLDDRLCKLLKFLETDKFRELPAAEQDRMRRQSVHMKEYCGVLGERIDAHGR